LGIFASNGLLEDIHSEVTAVGARGDKAYAKGFEVDFKKETDLFIPFRRQKAHKALCFLES
jgi:hypothetical protein